MTTATLPPRCIDHPGRHQAGCPACRTRTAAVMRRRTRLIAYGQWDGLVDTTPAREHVAALIKAGMSRRQIAALAEVGRTVVDGLAAGTLLQAQGGTVRKVLAVAFVIPDNAWMDSLGTSRRLQALMAIGWDAKALAAHLDVSTEQVRKWRYRYQNRVRYHLHRRVAELYRRLSDTPGPSQMAVWQARCLNYPGPIHWDDDGDFDSAKHGPKGFKPRFSETTTAPTGAQTEMEAA